MSEPLFDIVFFGILQPGKDRETVQQNMAKLFKTEPEKLQSYFSGDRKVIKSKVDELVAEKYRAALENVGLVIKIEPVEVAEDTAEPESAASPEPAGSTPDENTVDTSGISIAEVGADVLAHPVAVEPQPIGDISALSMAEVGSDVLEHPEEVIPQAIPDIGEISVAETGADLLEHPVEVAPQAIEDISELSMAEAGADVYEHPPEKPEEPEIDLSELSVEKAHE